MEASGQDNSGTIFVSELWKSIFRKEYEAMHAIDLLLFDVANKLNHYRSLSKTVLNLKTESRAGRPHSLAPLRASLDQRIVSEHEYCWFIVAPSDSFKLSMLDFQKLDVSPILTRDVELCYSCLVKEDPRQLMREILSLCRKPAREILESDAIKILHCFEYLFSSNFCPNLSKLDAWIAEGLPNLNFGNRLSLTPAHESVNQPEHDLSDFEQEQRSLLTPALSQMPVPAHELSDQPATPALSQMSVSSHELFDHQPETPALSESAMSISSNVAPALSESAMSISSNVAEAAPPKTKKPKTNAVTYKAKMKPDDRGTKPNGVTLEQFETNLLALINAPPATKLTLKPRGKYPELDAKLKRFLETKPEDRGTNFDLPIAVYCANYCAFNPKINQVLDFGDADEHIGALEKIVKSAVPGSLEIVELCNTQSQRFFTQALKKFVIVIPDA